MATFGAWQSSERPRAWLPKISWPCFVLLRIFSYLTRLWCVALSLLSWPIVVNFKERVPVGRSRQVIPPCWSLNKTRWQKEECSRPIPSLLTKRILIEKIRIVGLSASTLFSDGFDRFGPFFSRDPSFLRWFIFLYTTVAAPPQLRLYRRCFVLDTQRTARWARIKNRFSRVTLGQIFTAPPEGNEYRYLEHSRRNWKTESPEGFAWARYPTTWSGSSTMRLLHITVKITNRWLTFWNNTGMLFLLLSLVNPSSIHGVQNLKNSFSETMVMTLPYQMIVIWRQEIREL